MKPTFMNNSHDIYQRIKHLREVLEQHNEAYYVLDKPTISDAAFDELMRELLSLEASYPQYFDPNSPTQKVGGRPTKHFPTIKHQRRMYSLDNVYDKSELQQWETRLKKQLSDVDFDYTCELKYDGASISLIYENGELTQAITRGDGQQGDLVTNNIKTIQSLPKHLSGDKLKNFEVRGEVIIPKKAFEQLNQKRIAEDLPIFANPRNTASGSLKLQDTHEVANRPLDCLCYQFLSEEATYQSHFGALQGLKKHGFKVPDTLINAKDLDAVWDFIKHWEAQRDALDCEIDGVVVKVNQLDFQEELGHTAKSPRWAVAYKFKATAEKTVLESVHYQVGRTGAITPVAQLAPVSLAGTVVKRASLHNADQIAKLDLHIGDTVMIEKGGDIIPKVVAVLTENRPKDSKPIVYIDTCPDCAAPLQRNEGDAKHYCVNEQGCPPQVIGRIAHFVSRKAMDIEGLAGETIETLYRSRLVTTYADLYDLKVSDLSPLERMGEKSAQNVVLGVEHSKQIPFERVLYALGIRFVGVTTAATLATAFKNMRNLMQASLESLVATPEIGEKIAQSVLDFFAEEANQQMIEKLASFGVQMEMTVEETNENDQVLEGKTFVISGVFAQYSRDEIKNLVKEHGGRVSGGLSGKTDFLIAGDKMGPAKRQKATNLGIPLLDEASFLTLIDKN